MTRVSKTLCNESWDRLSDQGAYGGGGTYCQSFRTPPPPMLPIACDHGLYVTVGASLVLFEHTVTYVHEIA